MLNRHKVWVRAIYEGWILLGADPRGTCWLSADRTQFIVYQDELESYNRRLFISEIRHPEMADFIQTGWHQCMCEYLSQGVNPLWTWLHVCQQN